MNLIVTEDISALRGLIRRRKLRIDPSAKGELQRLQSDPSIRKSFFAAHGMRLDDAGEALHEAGFLIERPSPAAVLDVLAHILPSSPQPRQLRGVPVLIAELMIDGKERTKGQIKRALALRLDVGRCICRDIRRLRGKTYGKFTMPIVKRRGQWFYYFTPKDIVKAHGLINVEGGR